MAERKPRVIIVGGSLGGLFAGVSLLRLGFDVSILERSPSLQAGGAGIVLNGDLLTFLLTFDRTRTQLAVESSDRVYLNREDEVIAQEGKAQTMTSWDSLYWVLRANFDGLRRGGEILRAEGVAELEVASGRDEGRAEYLLGRQVRSFSFEEATEQVEVVYSLTHPSTPDNPPSTEDELHSLRADILIAADGASSSFRAHFSPQSQRKYAGYLAFRGIVPESDLDATGARLLGHFAFFHAGTNDGSGNTQFLSYTIPGAGGDLTPGRRNINWVWYENYRDVGVPLDQAKNTLEEDDRGTMLTDAHGRTHQWSIESGLISQRALDGMCRKAAGLPASMRSLVLSTPNPFIQTITDVVPPLKKLIHSRGHFLLVGDAVLGPRPHTAASTNQAAVHALSLFHTLNGTDELEALFNVPLLPLEAAKDEVDEDGEEGQARRETFGELELMLKSRWEKSCVDYARLLYSSGMEMGNRSQFGIHPMSVDKPAEVTLVDPWAKAAAEWERPPIKGKRFNLMGVML